MDVGFAPPGCGMNSPRALILPSDKHKLWSPLAPECRTAFYGSQNKKGNGRNPKNPDPSRKFVGLMVDYSHRRNRTVDIIPFLGHTDQVLREKMRAEKHGNWIAVPD